MLDTLTRETSATSEYQLLIGGDLLPGGKSVPVINPATGEEIAQCPRATAAQAEEAVAAAHAAFPAWAALPIAQRQGRLRQLADALEGELDELSRLLTQEQGKPLAESQWELQASIAIIRHFATTEMPVKVLEDSAERRVEQHRRPLGVVAAIVPWNFPVLLMMFKLPPALLAGNTLVVKPSPTTSLISLRIARICAGIFPRGVVNMIADSNDLGPFLTSHPDVRKVSFTGATPTGRRVMASAAETLKRVTLELGGNDAAIVLGDVDPVEVAPAIFQAAFMNCGQVCLAIKRVYVHDSIYDAMCEQLANIASATKVGNGLDADTQLGPLNNRMQFDKVLGYIEAAREAGTILSGGKALDGPGYFIAPTIVSNVTDGDRIVDEEQFGPVLPIIRYSDPEDALARCNASPMGLGGSVWGRDAAQLGSLASRMNSGMVWVNKHLDVGPHIPFAGSGDSGVGVELGAEGLAEFTQIHIINMSR